MRKETSIRMDENLNAISKIMGLNLGRECDKLILSKLKSAYEEGKPIPEKIKELIKNYWSEKKEEAEKELLKFTVQNPQEFNTREIFNLLNENISRTQAQPIYAALQKDDFKKACDLILNIINSGQINHKVLEKYKTAVIEVIGAKEKQRKFYGA